MAQPTTLRRRLEKLEARRQAPQLVDLLNVNAAFFMGVFEATCTDCPDRLRYPRCPRYDCALLLETLDDEAAQLNLHDERERAMFEGFEIWKTKRDRSEWLAGGFHLFYT
ncbi:MAG: hypothetical protein ACXV6L_01530 [Halobacteriota archaeon]